MIKLPLLFTPRKIVKGKKKVPLRSPNTKFSLGQLAYTPYTMEFSHELGDTKVYKGFKL